MLKNIPKKTRRAPILVASVLSTFLAAATGSAHADTLFGVTGNGAREGPTLRGDAENLYTVSVAPPFSIELFLALGPGDDTSWTDTSFGESIAINTDDGLIYRWSGASFNPTPRIMETIDPVTKDVTNVPMDLDTIGYSGYDPGEVRGSTYDPISGSFLITDEKPNLSAVTPEGVWSLIGPLSAFSRGIAFNNGSLWVGDKRGDRLRKINPMSGADIIPDSSITVTLNGFTVNGILSLTTDPDSGLLYGILRGAGKGNSSSGKSDRQLVTIVTTGSMAGKATKIGDLPKGFANIEFFSDDDDIDNDGILNVDDNCPTVFNPGRAQTGLNAPFGDACVHKTVDLTGDVVIGDNPIIGEGTTFEDPVKIGDNAEIGSNVQFKHHVRVGDNFVAGNETIIETNTADGGCLPGSGIGDDVILRFKVTLQSCVVVGDRVDIGDDSVVGVNTIIHDDVMLGMNVTIGANVTVDAGFVIGECNTVADGATVSMDLPPVVPCP